MVTSMAANVILRSSALWRAFLREDRNVLFIFAATLFLSAALLFSVQPMFAKLVLPKLGGSPSVWAVSMCFFQAMLLGGYGYAYVLTRWVGDGHAVLIHLALMAVTCLALPFGLPAAYPEPPQGEAYLWLMGLLLVGVGLPFFVVSANAPLLQAWFSRTRNHDAADPYFLYAASNLGSLIALIAYPVLLEPIFGLRTQAKLWFAAFDLLALMIAASGMALIHCPSSREGVVPTLPVSHPASSAIGWPDRLVWIGLAFLPSALVIAVTTYVTTDVASAPFLWVVPLALFLATFVLVFRDPLPFNYKIACEVLPATILVVMLTQTMLASSVFAIISFLLAAVICHRQLYVRRPSAQHLTEFYFWMSVGGVLGGIFAALAAPHLFNSVFEFPLLVLLVLLCRPGIVFGRSEPLDGRRVCLIIAAGVALLGAYKLAMHAGLTSTSGVYLLALICVVCLGLLLIRSWPEHRAALVLTMIACAALSPADLYTVYVERSFFGTHRVMLTDDGTARLLLHGTTVHGAERLTDASGHAVAGMPATYYHASGPLARGVELARENVAKGGAPMRVGIVGLGTGSLACYARGGEAWRYYEIDPVVVRIAANPRMFDFLERCMPGGDIVIGDARLTLAREPPASFSYLVIDAFSSDSIPVHLLTAEALQLFLDKLAPDGLLALHVSNRHLDLASALAATIDLVHDAEAAYVNDQRKFTSIDAVQSQVVFVAKNHATLAKVLAWPDAKRLVAGNVRAWTDDYSDVFGAMVRRLRG